MKRSLIVALVLLIGIPQAIAASSSSSSLKPLSYSDIPSSAWFSESVLALRHDGYLDAAKAKFFPDKQSTRAEFLKLVLAIDGVKVTDPPLLPSFDDVPKDSWYFGILEEAAKETWIRGDRECYGSHPCRAYPESRVTRAEAAALLVRVFGWERLSAGTPFIDIGDSDWFAYAVYAAADHCILSGNKDTMRIRPHDPINRAEMAVMLHRSQLVKSGTNVCGKSKS